VGAVRTRLIRSAKIEQSGSVVFGYFYEWRRSWRGVVNVVKLFNMVTRSWRGVVYVVKLFNVVTRFAITHKLICFVRM
jgi:hypothetical protein